ncbi:carbonic anhydrase [Parafrigoribacterium mesophilum]
MSTSALQGTASQPATEAGATMTLTPAQAWEEMRAGNERFTAGVPEHPHQDVERRSELADDQAPHVVLLGCSDSRLSSEIIFDKGLGDLFVVRNAGHIVSDSVIGSLEYAVEILHVPLVVVLGHDTCGAVRAAIDSLGSESATLPPHIASLIEPIIPAARRVKDQHPQLAEPDAAEVGREHVRDTVAALVRGSEIISAAIAAGTLAIVGANYRLREGNVVPHTVVGTV